MGDQLLSTQFVSFDEPLEREFTDSIQAKKRTIEEQLNILNRIANLLANTLRNGNKVLLFGNGGSAADSQHIAAELVSRFRRERAAFPAIALTTDTSILTAISNDYGFEGVFARQVEALGQEGDLAIGISTSGNSTNVLNAIQRATAAGLQTVGFTGQDGGKLKEYVDLCFCVSSKSTPHIQEVHITAAHALCEVVEKSFCHGAG